MRRRTWLAGAALLTLTSTGAVVALSTAGGATSTSPQSSAITVPVQRGTLSGKVSLDGTLTYRARPDGSPYSAINQARGTYTALPEVGDELDCGAVFYRVDDDPVLLLCGRVPAYRDLALGDRGQDVRQLNQNLHALGYGVGLDPDEHAFTSATRAALEKFQDEQGLNPSGQLALDEAIFLPEPIRVAGLIGQLGGTAQPGTPVLEATSDALEVQVNLDPSQQGLLKEGDAADITLPGATPISGTVDRVGRVAQIPEGQNTASVPAYLSLDDPATARGLDRAPVSVDITTAGVDDVLNVPVTALVGRSGGGFAVEVVRVDGARELVAVALGLFDDSAGRVEVEGDVVEGDLVVVPST